MAAGCESAGTCECRLQRGKGCHACQSGIHCGQHGDGCHDRCTKPATVTSIFSGRRRKKR